MRATTRSTPKVSRAIRAARILELSPDVTAANASASAIFASFRASLSNPDPSTIRPLKSAGKRRKALRLRSTIATEYPSASRARARPEPTLPQPTMTMCTTPFKQVVDGSGDIAAISTMGHTAGRGRAAGSAAGARAPTGAGPTQRSGHGHLPGVLRLPAEEPNPRSAQGLGAAHPGAAGQPGGDRGAGPRHDLFVGVRHRGDASHHGSDHRDRSVQPGDPHHAGDPCRDVLRDVLVSAGDRGLHPHRW